MSFPTKPAFVHYGTWDDETRAHPAMKWMEEYTYTFDSQNLDKIQNHAMTPDHILIRTTGQTHRGAAESAKTLYNEIYAPFAKWSHVPTHIVCYEVANGWEMVGFATLYWTLKGAGKQESGEQKVKDAEGREWDGAGPAAFEFSYRKGEGGMRLAKTGIAADPTAAVVGMLKRGLMRAEDLLK